MAKFAEITFDGPSLQRVANDVLALMLPPAQRRRWLSRMGRMVIAQTKKNVNDQKTVDGDPMTPRKRRPPKARPVYHQGGGVTFKSTHQKMLVDMVKSKWLGVQKLSDEEAVVGFFRNAGIVAYRHQHGIGEKAIKKTLNELFSQEEIKPYSPESHRRVSREVAIELVKYGVRQSVVEILRSWSNFEAAVYLAQIKAQRIYKTPARPVLGVSDEQKIVMGDVLMNGIFGKFKAKSYSNLLH